MSPGGATPHPDLRPLDPKSKEAMPAREQPGYYPGLSTMAQQNFWDEATRRKVSDRVHQVPPVRFFTASEASLLAAICDHVIPQHDRLPSRRIPLVERMDERLHAGRIPGYRFEKMPPDGDAYRLGFQAIEKMALHNFSRPFLELTWSEQETLLKSIHDGKTMAGAEEIWRKMEIHRYWALLLGDCCDAYYSHPWAWDEIGFGGPAYPRGYMRLENGEPEPWEVKEKRYEWIAPAAAKSDPVEEEIAAHQGQAAQGQGGTH